jgi:hypothetical protein
VYPRPFSRLDQADAVRTRIASANGSWMFGDHMQTATSYADPAIGAVFTAFGVSEARAEDMGERLAQYARKSAPRLMAREWSHE